MITGESFLEYAKKLAARGSSNEAEQRSAISRAYDGAYHVARKFLKDLGIDRADHQEVKNCLCYSGNAEAKLAGDRLADLGTARRRADYEIDKALGRRGDDPLAYVRVQVEAAENIVVIITKLRQQPNALKAGIEKFLESRTQSRGTPPSNLN
jgi:uncharacterized protein YjiS (DUF1127 family)